VGFFAIGEKPSGAGDPYALRRAALGIIRIVRENRLRLNLVPLIDAAGHGLHHHGVHPVPPQEILDFLADRLRVQLRAEGARHDVLAAAFAAHGAHGADDDITRLLTRANAVAELLRSPEGTDLLTAYRRAANILRIEERKDGPHDAPPDRSLFVEQAEIDLDHSLGVVDEIMQAIQREEFAAAMTLLARLRAPLDGFFARVTVNAPEANLRRNRLRLLNRVRASMDRLADFSRIEG